MENMEQIWNSSVHTFHGGQDWRSLENFVEDYSVTTNAFGTPLSAAKAATDALQTMHHYPARDTEPAKTQLANFLSINENSNNIQKRLVLGNGASELIDLCIRLAPGKTWRAGPCEPQYQEYARSAANYKRTKLPFQSQSADLLCIVNPSNPTGKYFTVNDMMHNLENAWNVPHGSTVIVDESMQPWIGSLWREESLISKGEWISFMAHEKQIKIFIIHSWTKLWSCTGLRVGSILCPTDHDCLNISRYQVPWSMNSAAIAFLAAVVKDEEYLNKTWKWTSIWRAQLCEGLSRIFPNWTFHGANFISFIWIDTHNESVAQECVLQCRKGGMPIRWGGLGYESPTCIRIAVRSNEKNQLLIQCLNTITKIKNYTIV
ncbi:histidinol-phosphate aminotransferase-like isoform X3 [Hylaeus volcanicus]|uniref:histidinol-phosphate aminotransferase-like isoform X3 n=1 Tax=Hylaeus volcanicus TaxID=313075 RepID=UPI0023B8617A|nr:histidinol-phosphate aminotransferase-like isoform X3 [Hylaeus volcanicus]